MKRILSILIGSWLLTSSSLAQLPMHGWKIHTAYNNVTRVEMGHDKVYALSEGAMFAVDKDDQSITYYNKLTGLTSTNIVDFKYDPSLQTLIVAYANGHIDLIRDDEVTNIPDLYHKQMSISKAVNAITTHGDKAYLAMDFGIVVLNLQREEIADSYYIGENGSEVDVKAVAIVSDSIYAISSTTLYRAYLYDNLVDYSQWEIVSTLPSSGDLQNVVAFGGNLYLLRGNKLYVWVANAWREALDKEIHQVKVSGGQLLGLAKDGTWVTDGKTQWTQVQVFINAPDVAYEPLNQVYWFAYYADGLGVFYANQNTINHFLPSGPITNTAYRMRFSGNRLYIVPGGYLGVFNNTPGAAMIYEEGQWINFTQAYMQQHIGRYTEDYSDIIADPNDPKHFYVGSFGYGLIEFRNDEFYMRYMPDNSGIEPIIADNWEKYTWVDAFAFDANNNLWMANISDGDNIKVLTADEKWINYNHDVLSTSERMKNILIDQNNSNIKYIVGAYIKASIVIMNDNGTIDYWGDDKTQAWGQFVDEDGNSITPNYMHCAAFDKSGALWVGTESGVLKFAQPQNLFMSNACSRIKIARQDGSGLADYLLNAEQINAIAVDGANRIWFGTEMSGAYLMDLSDSQNIVTVHHYTTDNSPIPSNTILSIAINPITGEVFFGTGGGLVSYQSDAAEGKEDFSNAYAYPNPVRENFDGIITIAGLMEDTQVRIIDNSGNLVYQTQSNGGIAIWDGRNGKGERVSSGVYFAMCVTADGANDTSVKILIMN